MKSIIKKTFPASIVYLPATLDTPKTTFTKENYYKPMLFVARRTIGTILIRNGDLEAWFSNSDVTASDNGDGTVTISGLSWWDYPYLLKVD